MFVFYVINSYSRVFQRLLLGCNWSPHLTIQLVPIWSRLVFVLVSLTCFGCNLLCILFRSACSSFLNSLREGKYLPTFFNKVVCILNLCLLLWKEVVHNIKKIIETYYIHLYFLKKCIYTHSFLQGSNVPFLREPHPTFLGTPLFLKQI